MSQKTNKSECCEACAAGCLGCSAIILSLALIGSCIAYVVFGIMFLVEYYDEAMDCNDSTLWAYVLVGVIMTLTNILAAKNAKKEDKSPCEFVIIGLIYTGLAAWGGVEIWEKACNELEETELYEFAIATFCFHVFGASITLVVFPCVIIFAACNSNDKSGTVTTAAINGNGVFSV